MDDIVMPSGSSSRSAMEIELSKLSSPRIFLVRMLVFLVLCGLITVVLYKQILTAFFANPGLNALIIAVLLIGTILSFRQVIRLYPEVSWVNNFRIADPGLAIERRPALLAPMAAILGGERSGRMTISQQTMRHLLDSIATRLDEARDISRYMTGLLVFLGLLGTFWGLIETVGSVGKVIEGLKVGGDAQSRRSHPGPGRAYAYRAADDPRMGRRPGRAKPRDQEVAGADRQAAREELTNIN